MARLMAAQDIRTPLNFIKSMHRWDQQIPEMINRTLRESIKLLGEATDPLRLCRR